MALMVSAVMALNPSVEHWSEQYCTDPGDCQVRNDLGNDVSGISENVEGFVQH
jgi:hypothetical protein